MAIKSGYGTAPKLMGKFDIEFTEMMLYLYLPVKMAGKMFNIWDVPQNLAFMGPMLWDLEFEGDDYVYITAKNQWFEPGGTYNRPGWHTDGFMTDDVNYIWSDGPGTEIFERPMSLTQDHSKSMKEMEAKCWIGATDHRHYKTDPDGLYRLDEKVIHRPPKVVEAGMRGFIKISVSKDRYDLRGNSHNYLLDYSWEMKDRKAHRNDPIARFNI